MKIKFEQEGDNYYAISEDVEYKGQLCESLWWGEIMPYSEGYNIQFDDDYRNKILVGTLEIAKDFILKNYHSHTPQIIGRRYDL